MSELQMGLLALGGVAVLGVFGYNKWQELQHRKVAERVFQPSDDDVLLNKPSMVPAAEAEPVVSERREPGLTQDWQQEPEEDWQAQEETSSPSVTAPAADPWDEPLHASSPSDELPVPEEQDLPPWEMPEMPVAAPASPEVAEVHDVPLPATLLSPGVDAIATLELVEPVAAGQLLASQRDALKRLRKPVHWAGFNAAQGAWEFITPETHAAYCRLRVGLQLANRQGPVSPADFSLFSTAMQQLADELMAVVDMPSSQVALDQAQNLDRFCADVDMQIGVNLVSRGTPFAGTKIRALAESAGMVLAGNGCYTRRDDDGRTLFTLQNFEASGFEAETLKSISTHGLVFLLDVPRVPKGLHVYSQMVELAKRFAEALNGALVDDNRQALADPQLAQIRQEYVVKPQAAMDAQGIPAGGALALRLFA